jgi:histidine ammonia-lyase
MADTLELSGLDLRIEDVELVAQRYAAVTLSAAARDRMLASREVVEELVAAGATVYGVTTGFGDLANRRVEPAEARHLQHNMLVSHAVGVGPDHDRATVRAMLLLRANTLARGQSGCRPLIVVRMLDVLPLGLPPRVPEQGSVGA